MLNVENLTAGYDRNILEGICFRADPGELAAVLGRNGCGKTTLLRALAGGLPRVTGKIEVSGVDIAPLSPRRRARLLALLPQQTRVIPGITPRQILEMGRYSLGGPSGDSVQETARLLALEDLLEEDCARLSQGQRQLVLLGRCLVQDPQVLLLDEPNAALDYDNTHRLFALLSELARQRKKTALLVLHDPELALRYCPRLLVLKDGRLCRDLHSPGPEEAREALEQLYPGIQVYREEYTGQLRCRQG